MRSGQRSTKAKDIAFHEAVDDPETRAEFIRRQCLLHQLVTTAFRQLPIHRFTEIACPY